MKKLIAEFSGEDYADTVKLTLVEESGLIKKKLIGINEFALAVNDSLYTRKTGGFRRIGRLPKGLYDFSVNDCFENSFGCIIDVPEMERFIVYVNKHNKKSVCLIPIPHMVFFFKVDTGHLTGYCYAVKDDEIADDTELYYFPFSNVSHDNGRICYGFNSVDGYDSLEKTENAVELFFQAPFNGDYYRNGITNGSGLSMIQLFDTLKNAESRSFPEEILTPAKEEHEIVTIKTKARKLRMGWN